MTPAPTMQTRSTLPREYLSAVTCQSNATVLEPRRHAPELRIGDVRDLGASGCERGAKAGATRVTRELRRHERSDDLEWRLYELFRRPHSLDDE